MIFNEPGSPSSIEQYEKENRVFAKLFIQLPSSAIGGEMIVGSGNEKIIYRMGQMTGMAPYNLHFVVHYAQCPFQVMPIQSGYRLGLVYSLCWPIKKFGPVPSRFFDQSDPTFLIKNELDYWDRGDEVINEMEKYKIYAIVACRDLQFVF